MEKVQVLYITDNLKQRSGVTAVIRNYLKHFDWNKIQVDLLVLETSEANAVEQMRNMGANVYFMPVLGLKNAWHFYHYLKAFFAEHNYKIVHSHFFQLNTFVFPIAKRACGCKCISHCHSTKYSEYRFRSFRNWVISRGIGRVSDVWAACSIEAGEFLYGKTFRNSPKKLLVINGIETKEYLFNNGIRIKKRNELGIGKSEIVVGHIGRMAPPKNPLFLIDVLNELLRIDNRYRLMMVGNGPMEEEIRKKAQNLGLTEKIYFVGVRSDVPELINVFDLFLFPSLYEGLGIVAVEAQANGLPCIVSDVVPPEVDLTGIKMLSLKEGAQAWAQTISETSFERKTENNQKVVDAGYDIKDAANELQSFYEKLLLD